MWLKHLILHLCPKLNLFLEGSFHKTYCQGLWKKQMNYMLFLPWQNVILQQLASTFGSLRRAYDVFALMINFLSNDW